MPERMSRRRMGRAARGRGIVRGIVRRRPVRAIITADRVRGGGAVAAQAGTADVPRLPVAAPPARMGGGNPEAKMSQDGSLAISRVALWLVTPFFSQVATNDWSVEKLYAAFQLGKGPLLRRPAITYRRMISSVSLLWSGIPGYLSALTKSLKALFRVVATPSAGNYSMIIRSRPENCAIWSSTNAERPGTLDTMPRSLAHRTGPPALRTISLAASLMS